MARKRKSAMEKEGEEVKHGSRRNRGPPVMRNAANARERARMRVLSKAFSKLKTTLPWVPADTKLSKLDTLRLASCYIGHLKQILLDDNAENGDIENTSDNTPPTGSPQVHPINLTWPFSFNGRTIGGGKDSDGMKLPTQTEITSGSS